MSSPARGRRDRRRVAAAAVACSLVLPLAVTDLSAAAPPVVPAPGAPAVLPAVAVEGSTAPAPDPASVRAAVAPALQSGAWTSIAVSVVDPADGRVLVDIKGDRPAAPASTLKVLTGLTVLTALGPDTRLRTRVVRQGSTVVIVGAGDATLTRNRDSVDGLPTASLDRLATLTATALGTSGGPFRVAFDDSLFTGPSVSPNWAQALLDYGVVAPVSALSVDQGRESPDADSRSSTPAASAASYFASALGDRGIEVTGEIERRKAPSGAAEVAAVDSPPVGDIVEFALRTSNNDVAEALAHLAGGKLAGSASFAGGVKATRQVLGSYGIPMDGMSITDGSGLSRDDRVEPITLTRAWQAMVNHARPDGIEVPAVNGTSPGPVGWQVAVGAPVAGFTGTLAERFDSERARAGLGVVRAKTGTLTGVSSLSGTVNDREGRLLVFAALATGVPDTDSARNALDRFAADLAACGCSISSG